MPMDSRTVYPLPLTPRPSGFNFNKDSPMTNVYEGTSDGRQSDKVDMPVSRFRPRYRALTEDEKKLHDELKAQADVLDRMFQQVKSGRYNSLATTSLEQAIMWIVKELTS
jgi:hypothetical protein